jgi:hypothetical protein
MHPAVARQIATTKHAGQRTRSGEPVLAHLTRVAAAVDAPVRTTAWLHDVFERSDATVEELRAHGLTSVELAALELLTRSPTESYELYVLRIARAPGPAGRLARTVKLADLDDHVRRPPRPGDPPYARAQRRLASARRRRDVARRDVVPAGA